MKNLFKVFSIIALAAVIGFSMAACEGDDDGGGGGATITDHLNGKWESGDGETITFSGSSFVVAQDGEAFMRGTYTTGARSISATITMTVKEAHGNFLTEILGDEEVDVTFTNKWYAKNDVTNLYKAWLKTLDPSLTNAQITEYLDEYGVSDNIDALFPTTTAAINDNSMTLTVFGETSTYTKSGGSTTPGGQTPGGQTPGGNSGWNAVANSTFGGNSFINAIAYGNGKFVAVGDDGKIAYSTNGATWTAVPNSTFGSNGIYDIAFGDGKFVAVGSTSIAYSSDGVSWAAANTPFVGGRAIAYGGGKFVVGRGSAGGDASPVAYSSDGIQWTRGTGNMYSHEAIAYGGGMFVVVSGNANQRGYSSDGVNWTRVTYNSTTYDRAVAYGSGKFIAVAGYGRIVYSSDGATWNTVQSYVFEGDDINAIIFANGKFAAGGDKGKIATSNDGITWTKVGENILGTYTMNISGIGPVTVAYDILAIAYGNGTFVVGGQSGKIAYSTGN